MTLRSRHEGNEKRPEANHGAEEMARSYDDMDEMLRKASAAGSAGSEWDGGDAGATSGGAGDGPAPAIKRRAPIACRRCRRMRSKCVHDKAQPPCKACMEAGLGADDCIFPVRGQPDNDREFRHPRIRAEKATRRDPAKVRRDILDTSVAQTGAQRAADEWELLPPLPDIVEAVNRFTTQYFQLGFLPKQQFSQRLLQDHRSVNVFLVLGILSISARLTPALVARYGSGIKASEFFMERAAGLAHAEIYQEPTLERCQAFYLLSIAQHGSGLRNPSYINMGISMRMATLMQLHREESYQIPTPTTDLVIRSESARRTLWMLYSQDQLHSGPYSPVSLAASDITTLLPCDESDFALGREPQSRAALQDTPPAVENPGLICDLHRSLFASLLQAHHFWGIVRRRAVNLARSSAPWDPTSKFALMDNQLRDWEHGLPHEHVWNSFALKRYQAEGQELAFLGVTMIPRLCHVVLRRPYLTDILNLEYKDSHQQAFFSNVSLTLFHNVHQMFEQIDEQFTGRSLDEAVGGQMAVFCVYSCGLFAGYLCKYPNICPDPGIVNNGPIMLQRTRSILSECQEVWPVASRWLEALDQFTQNPSTMFATEGSMSDGRDPLPQAVPAPSTASGSSTSPSPSLYKVASHFSQASSTLQSPSQMVPPFVASSNPGIHGQFSHTGEMQPSTGHGDSHFFVPPAHTHTHMYMGPTTPVDMGHHPAANNLGMPMDTFHPPPQQQASSSFSMSSSIAPTTGSFYPPLGPATDGYESELQNCADGHPDFAPASGVFDGYYD